MIPTLPALRPILAIVMLSAAFGSGWVANGWRLGGQIAQTALAQTASDAAANAANRAQEHAANQTEGDIHDQLATDLTQSQADATHARLELGRLRQQLAAARGSAARPAPPGQPPDAGIPAAPALVPAAENVVGLCGERLVIVASHADAAAAQLTAWRERYQRVEAGFIAPPP